MEGGMKEGDPVS